MACGADSTTVRVANVGNRSSKNKADVRNIHL